MLLVVTRQEYFRNEIMGRGERDTTEKRVIDKMGGESSSCLGNLLDAQI